MEAFCFLQCGLLEERVGGEKKGRGEGTERKRRGEGRDRDEE